MRPIGEKLKESFYFIIKVLTELSLDLYIYYSSPYPLLLIIGALKRIRRKIKYLWLPKGPGRPPVHENAINLILDMKRSNLLWGAKRIRDELRLLGINLHKKTIKRILRENGFTTPPMKYHPPTWRSLLASSSEIWAMDFCNIIDLKLFQIYILGIINVKSRMIISLCVTTHPNKAWIIQQFRNIAIDEIEFPKYIIIDNDGIYGNWLDPTLKDYFGIKTLRINPGCPWENGIIERYFLTLELELLYRINYHNEEIIRKFCDKYKKYYNNIRPHQGIDGHSPSGIKQFQSRNIINLKTFSYKKKRHIYGLFTEFKLAA